MINESKNLSLLDKMFNEKISYNWIYLLNTLYMNLDNDIIINLQGKVKEKLINIMNDYKEMKDVQKVMEYNDTLHQLINFIIDKD